MCAILNIRALNPRSFRKSDKQRLPRITYVILHGLGWALGPSAKATTATAKSDNSNSLTHSLTLSLTHSLTYLLYLLTYLLSYLLTYLLTYFTYLLTYLVSGCTFLETADGMLSHRDSEPRPGMQAHCLRAGNPWTIRSTSIMLRASACPASTRTSRRAAGHQRGPCSPGSWW